MFREAIGIRKKLSLAERRMVSAGGARLTLS
jgi:hypothetical protein